MGVMSIPQAQVVYGGRVQGVGFRYSTVSLSRQFRVTGWVRNLSDGRVELVAAGSREEVEHFLQAVEKEFSHFIQERHISWGQSAEPGDGFEVRY